MSIESKQRIFEKKFEEKVKDILVLTDDSHVGACGMGKGIWKPVRDFLAYVDLETGEVKEGKGRIEWLAEEKDKGDWIYHLGQEKIYHLQVRELKDKTVPQGKLPWLSNTFLLVRVVERDVSNAALADILAEYKKPVVIEDEQCGTFSLERQFSWFSGEVDWLGEDCNVSLETDEEGGKTAEKALKSFHKIYEDLENWDQKFKEFAAEKLTDLANDWLEEDGEVKEITKEDFAERIWISEMTITPDGNFEAYYFDDDLFWGHIIIVSGNITTGLEDAVIAG